MLGWRGKMKSNITNKSNNNNKTNKSNKVLAELSQKNASPGKPSAAQKGVSSVRFVRQNLPENSATEKICKFLYLNPQSSPKQISVATDINIDNVYSEIHRNKTLIVKRDKLFSLTTLKKNEIEAFLKTKFEAENRSKIKQVERLEKKQKKDETILRLKKLFTNYKSLISIDGNVVSIRANDLREIDPATFDLLEEKPKHTLEMMASVFEEMGIQNSQVRFNGLDVFHFKKIEEFRATHLGKLFVVDGQVSSVGTIRPKIVTAGFECKVCGAVVKVRQIDKKLKKPDRCSCANTTHFELVSKQLVNLAEIIFEDLENPESYSKKSITTLLTNDLIDYAEFKKFSPGNQLRILGELVEVFITSRSGTQLNELDWVFEAVSIEEISPEKSLEDIDEQTKNKFKELSALIDKKGLASITGSVAPDVYGHDHVKKTILIQSAQKRNDPKEKGTRTRSNILLLGDPGTAKSRLARDVVRLNYGSRRGSCGSASGVGITASTEQVFDKTWSVKPGLLPLTREICVLEEANLLSEDDSPKLQEALDDKTITIHKATIHTEIPVTASVFLTANPKDGRFNERDDLLKQVNIFSPIRNRMDAIFFFKDQINSIQDRKISETMLKRTQKKIKREYSADFLKDFLLFTRNLAEPKFSKELVSILPDFFASKRAVAGEEVGHRFQEALERFIVGCAKLRWSKTCEKKDLERSWDVLKHSYQFRHIGGFQ